jgi:hypothetical protein
MIYILYYHGFDRRKFGPSDNFMRIKNILNIYIHFMHNTNKLFKKFMQIKYK